MDSLCWTVQKQRASGGGNHNKRRQREKTEDCRIDSVPPRMATTLRPAPCHWRSGWAGGGSLLLPDWLSGPAAKTRAA